MANETINDLPAKSGALSGTEKIEIDDGSSKSVTTQQIADLAAGGADPRLVQVRTFITTSDTLVIGDAGGCVQGNNAAAITETIPPNSAVAFAIGTTILIRQFGGGAITLSAGAGVTLLNGYPTAKTAGQYKSLAVHKVDTNTWVLDGNAAAS